MDPSLATLSTLNGNSTLVTAPATILEFVRPVEELWGKEFQLRIAKDSDGDLVLNSTCTHKDNLKIPILYINILIKMTCTV